MSHFTPGQNVGKYQTQDGEDILLRYLQWNDLEELQNYINKLSSENTFITFSGEQHTLEQEMEFLTNVFAMSEQENLVFLAAEYDQHIIGLCEVRRHLRNKKRELHVGTFGLTIAKTYRGKGIGEQLARTTLNTAQKTMSGLRLIQLQVYQPNVVAQKLYRKLGFRKVGTIPQGIYFRGKYVDSILMVRESNP